MLRPDLRMRCVFAGGTGDRFGRKWERDHAAVGPSLQRDPAQAADGDMEQVALRLKALEQLSGQLADVRACTLRIALP